MEASMQRLRVCVNFFRQLALSKPTIAMRKRAFQPPCLTTPTSIHIDRGDDDGEVDNTSPSCMAPITASPSTTSAMPRRRLVSPICTPRPSLACPTAKRARFSPPRKPAKRESLLPTMPAPVGLPSVAALAGSAPNLPHLLGIWCTTTYHGHTCHRAPPQLRARQAHDTRHRHRQPRVAAPRGHGAAATTRAGDAPQPRPG